MIVVTGATGSIGGHLVRELRGRGAPLRALVRDEAKGRALGCDFAVGDFGDPGSLAAALDGADRLFLNGPGAVPAEGGQPMVGLLKNAIDAAREAGVSHVVKISVLGARRGGRLAQGAHWELDRYLEESGLAWSVLQPSGFMQNYLGPGAFGPDGRLIGSYGEAPVAHIDARDIAACAAVLLTQPRERNETFVLTGPEALTDAQVADKISKALGRPVGLLALPADELAAAVKAQGAPAAFAEDLAALVRDVAAGAQSGTTTTVQDLTGRPARTFDDFLADNLPALRAAAGTAS